MKERTVKTKQFHVYETHVCHSLCSTNQLFSNTDVHQNQIVPGANKVSSLIINNFLCGMGLSNKLISQMD